MDKVKHYNLNKSDRNFLYKKYINLGYTPKEAYNNVKQLAEHLKFLAEKLRLKKFEESEIENRLRVEFEKVCQELESKF